MAARTRFLSARPLISSPSEKSIARHTPPSPALKSLSGSGRLAPYAKVSFTFPLWALPTAKIPSRDHTGLPIHFHSSIISRSASRMLLRMLANVLPRQSVSPAISRSMRSDGSIGPSPRILFPRTSESGHEPSGEVLAAVRRQRRAGDEAGIIGREEDDAAGDLLRLAQPAERDVRQDVFLQHVLGHGLDHLGRDIAGADGVDGDPALGALLRQRFGEAELP